MQFDCPDIALVSLIGRGECFDKLDWTGLSGSLGVDRSIMRVSMPFLRCRKAMFVSANREWKFIINQTTTRTISLTQPMDFFTRS